MGFCVSASELGNATWQVHTILGSISVLCHLLVTVILWGRDHYIYFMVMWLVGCGQSWAWNASRKFKALALAVHCCPQASTYFTAERERGVIVSPPLHQVQCSHLRHPSVHWKSYSLLGEIDELAYISTNEYRFDGQEKSVVCTVSSDGTVRAWDLQEVSSPEEDRMSTDLGLI